jgi:hypothetical protein
MPATAAASSEGIAELMLGVGEGVAEGAEHAIGEEAIGWAMTSLGLDSDPDAEILAALDEIEQTLLDIENELVAIDELLQQQSCQMAVEVDAVQDAINATDIWVGRGSAPVTNSYLNLINDAQAGVDVVDDLNTLFDWTLHGNAEYPRLEDLMVGLDNALREQGNSEQVISACGLLIPPPSEEWDDRPYFEQLANLVGFYAQYQARAALLIVEAYHWNALQAWIAAGNDPASLSPDDVPSICNDAVGDVELYCQKAEDAYNNIRTNLRAQYGEAGAPYSTGTPNDPDATFDYDPAEGVTAIHNTSGTVWVRDIDDFFRKGGYSTSCQASTSKSPCGPGVGTYEHSTFEAYNSTATFSYGGNGGYASWRPATADMWEELTASWSGSGTTLADLMEDTHGFSGASTPRVYFSGEVDTTGHRLNQPKGHDYFWFDATRVACFVATPMNRGNSSQPFCSSGFENLMHATSDHTNSNNPCINVVNTDHGTLDDSGIDTPFFEFLYNMQSATCASSSHPDGQTFYPAPPGWLLQYESYKYDTSTGDEVEATGLVDVAASAHQKQYHWPALPAAGLDGSPLACTTEPATGQMRNAYALGGRVDVPRLCGNDFDAWFDKWIAPPAVAAAPALATPESVVVVLPPGSTATLAHHEVTAVVSYAHLVSAGDADVSCLPASGEAFQLGTTEVRCRATGSSGGTVERTFLVHVRYPFHFAGLLDRNASTRVKAGQPVPIAFGLGGERGLGAVVGSPTSMPVDCESGAALGEAEPVQGSPDLSYRRGTSLYASGWKTRKSWAGQCREISIALADGTHHQALVEFR